MDAELRTCLPPRLLDSRAALPLSLLLLLVIGFIDHHLHHPLTFTFLYLVPMFITARWVGRAAAILMFAAVVLFWTAASHYGVGHLARGTVLHWIMMLASFLAGALIYAALRERAERAMRRAEEESRASTAKSEMLALVNHQFANSLQVMGLVTALLGDDSVEGLTERERELQTVLRQHIASLTVLAENFLNEARLSSGMFALDLRPVDLVEMIEQIVESLWPLAERKGVAVRCDVPSGIPRIMADRDALGVVLTNLVANAVKYTPAGGSVAVEVRCEADGRRIVLSVRDTGVGMTTEERDAVMRGFTRTESGKREAKGFGLGLKVARDMLASHGSQLNLESQPGVGSRFWFVLERGD